jgi:hypothetical protein
MKIYFRLLTDPFSSSHGPVDFHKYSFVTEPEYRYDPLPSETNQSSAIAEYNAISKWARLKSIISFNDTSKLEGDTEVM